MGVVVHVVESRGENKFILPVVIDKRSPAAWNGMDAGAELVHQIHVDAKDGLVLRNLEMVTNADTQNAQRSCLVEYLE
jgi:hypothetical protein